MPDGNQSDDFADVPIIEHEPLTPEYIALKKDIVSLGREIVDLARQGRIRFYESGVIGDVLFVSYDTGFYVLPPDGEIHLAHTADVRAPWQPYLGKVSDLEKLRDLLKQWHDVAAPR